MQIVKSLSFSLLLAALSSGAQASLLNPSFEYPVQAAGGYNVDGIPGWKGGTGVWHIPTSGFFEANAPHGLQIGYTNGQAVAQQSSNVVGVGDNTVTVMGGRRHDGFSGSFKLNVIAGGSINGDGSVTGGILLASSMFTYTQYPIDSFHLLTATYTAAPGDPNLGQFITVQLVRTEGSQIDFDDVRVTSAGAESIAPSSFSINLGRVNSGNLASLADTDSNPLEICKFFVPNQSAPIIQFSVDGTTSINTPAALRFRTVSRMVQSGSYQQVLRLFNFTTNSYEENRTDILNTSYQTWELSGTGTLSRYVGSGGALRAQIQVRQTGPSTTLLPCSQYDLAGWDVAQ
ncbi:MAG: hypothetical protein JSS66_09125 [Armatimonadetes bacterium]|nr:hypothetical protein [Armatimonadota bacterium]